MVFTMSKQLAALSHFILSIIIFTIIIATMIHFWYPAPHFNLSGGWDGLKILAGVDLVLGPLLTLVVFNIKKPKKELVMDLSLIVLMQFAALGWGLHAIYQQRPVAIVFSGTEFFSFPASEYTKQNISPETLRQFGSQFPVLIYAKKPERDSVELEEMFRRYKTENIFPYHQINIYHPFKEFFSELKSNPIYLADIKTIIETNTELREELDSVLEETDKNIDDYVYFKLYSESHYPIMMFNAQGEFVTYLISSM